MKKKWFSLKTIVLSCVVAVYLNGCTEDNKERFETPPWLGGSSIETLETEGDCSIYLQLMEKAGYKDPIEKQLFTLFVPRDSAWQEYFKEAGISGLDDLSEEQATQLFTLHVLRNPRSEFQLIYEWAWGELQGPNGEYAALFMRKLTNSYTLPYEEEVRFDPALIGQKIIIDPAGGRRTDQNKWVPLFSTDYMEDYFATPDGSDYEFIYRESNWGGLQWHNARVVKSEVRTSSGFIYYIDQVVPPMPSIEQYLRDNPDKFGIFYDMAQRFARYNDNGENRRNEQVYVKTYNGIEDFANEQGPTPGDFLNHQNLFTIYAPRNDVMQAYLDKNVYPYYPSIDSMPEITLRYLVQSQITRTLGMKSKIEDDFINAFGDHLEIVADVDIADAYMCSNGCVYEMNRILEPNVFRTVVGPLFYNTAYSDFLNALILSEQLNSVSSPEFIVTLFVPTNDQMEAAGVRYNRVDDIMEYRNRQGIWIPYEEENLQEFVENHIIRGEISDFSGEGYVELRSHHYAYFNNNKIYAAGNYQDGDFTGFTDVEDNEVNGILYYLDNVIKVPDYTAAETIGRDPELSEVYALFSKANLVDTIKDPFTEDSVAQFNFMVELDYWTIFMPTNDAILQAKSEGLIPDDEDDLKDFLWNHFVRNEVIFDDGLKSGSYNTNFIDTISATGYVYGQLNISNSKNNLQVTDETGQLININHNDANIIVEGGVLHKIPSIIKREE